MTTPDYLYSLFLEHPRVTTDSRDTPPSSLFFALKGASFNGNAFASKALEAGCSYAVVDEPDAVTNERCLLVDNVLESLQALAHQHRLACGIQVIGITGTNGKTTTKELVAAVLSRKFNLLYTRGNLNNHIGVPLTLLQLTKEHEMAVIEMGANHPGEIRELAAIADPDFGLITNVGKAHLEGFGSFEGVIRTKGELYDHLRAKKGKVFINVDNPMLTSIAHGIEQLPYATSPGHLFWGETLSCSPFLNLKWHHGDREVLATTKLIGSYNLENALAAVRMGLYFGVSEADIVSALNDYEPSNNRSQLKKTERNTLIIDAYNANPTSMAAALRNFQLYEAASKAVILGSMKELGDQSLEEHKLLIAAVNEAAFDRVFLIGDEFKAVPCEFPVFSNTEEFSNYIMDTPLAGYTILIKGSRGNQLETVLPFL